MLINRRELIRSTALGSTSLALTPSFNHLMAEDAIPNEGPPHRFIFIRKSNGNLTKQFPYLPSLRRNSKSTRKKKHLKSTLQSMNYQSGLPA